MPQWWAALLLLLLCQACATDPGDGGAGSVDCSLQGQLSLVDGLMHEEYLWRAQVPEVALASYGRVEDLIRDLRRPDIDRWSYVTAQQTADAYFEQGMSFSYGYTTFRIESGETYVAQVSPGSGAASAGVQRGQLILDRQVADDGELRLTVRERGGEERTLLLMPGWMDVESVPVVRTLPRGDRQVGYLFVKSFVETARESLREAFEGFALAGIEELVVDLRYNGGGRVGVMQELADRMVGARFEGQTSFSLRHNPSLVELDEEYLFDALDPGLRLQQAVFILGSASASASEVLVSAMQPYLRAPTVGQRSVGKPVGMYAYGFCERVAFPVTFRLVNARGEGDYYDGIVPDCAVDEDFAHALGDPAERMLARALQTLDGAPCPAADTSAAPSDSSAAQRSEEQPAVPPADALRWLQPGLYGAGPLHGILVKRGGARAASSARPQLKPSQSPPW